MSKEAEIHNETVHGDFERRQIPGFPTVVVHFFGFLEVFSFCCKERGQLNQSVQFQEDYK